jgi:hypothetical protein
VALTTHTHTAEVKERVELLPPLCAFMAGCRVNFVVDESRLKTPEMNLVSNDFIT